MLPCRVCPMWKPSHATSVERYDDLVCRFSQTARKGGRIGYKREEQDFWIASISDLGWVV
jgi:hypothetical protein